MADSHQVGWLLRIVVGSDRVPVYRGLSPRILPVGAAGLDGPVHLHGGQIIMVMSAGVGCKGVARPKDWEIKPPPPEFLLSSAREHFERINQLFPRHQEADSREYMPLLRRPMIFHAPLWSAMNSTGRAYSVSFLPATCLTSGLQAGRQGRPAVMCLTERLAPQADVGKV
ncbi:hypothetical protein CVIRNUC_003736 [Coccomyxa viridis]|uniref:Uncharacterized protein n=1 Tax=Coccomyxa viridis TaxID=1274662 RepID=A0AAV1I0Z5_9CHLO|nr:hypothetical protein CVIRNUC_003736 [Coccomyxa viridis]